MFRCIHQSIVFDCSSLVCELGCQVIPTRSTTTLHLPARLCILQLTESILLVIDQGCLRYILCVAILRVQWRPLNKCLKFVRFSPFAVESIFFLFNLHICVYLQRETYILRFFNCFLSYALGHK